MTAAPSARRVILCADDFGLSDEASASIVELAGLAAISAASCVVDAPAFAGNAAMLARSRAKVAIGLHLNLTEGKRSRLRRSLVSWVLRAYGGLAPKRIELQSEIARQLDVFERTFDAAPCFVDGHEHVHQLPRIREALVDEIAGRYGGKVAVRSALSMQPRGSKAWAISQLGGHELRTLLAQRSLPTNSDFAGVYDFSTARPYDRRMTEWLRALADGGLIMCHPERRTVTGPAHSARQMEHDFLVSQAWSDMRRELDIALIPFRVAPGP